MSFSFRKFRRINGRPSLKAITLATMTYRYTRNTMARGISTPLRLSGPERFHRISVKLTSDTSASTAPMASERDELTKLVMSIWMRWSGLSIGRGRKRSR